MFMEGKDTIDVLKNSRFKYDEVRQYFGEYLTLKNLTDFINFYKVNQQFLPFLLKVIEKMKQFELFRN